jgi:hypothetical protein
LLDAKLERRQEQPHAKANSKSWEEQYAEFDDYDGMPETTSTSYKWQSNQLLVLMVKLRRRLQQMKGAPYGEIGK